MPLQNKRLTQVRDIKMTGEEDIAISPNSGTGGGTVQLNFLILKKDCEPATVFNCMLIYETLCLWISPGYYSVMLILTFYWFAIICGIFGVPLLYVAFLAIMVILKKTDWAATGELRNKVTQYIGFRRLGIILNVVVIFANYCLCPVLIELFYGTGDYFISILITGLITTLIYVILTLWFLFLNTKAFEQAADIMCGGDGSGMSVDDPMAQAGLGTPFAPQ